MCLGKIYISYTDVDLSSWVIFMVCIISHDYKGTIFNIKGSLWTQMDVFVDWIVHRLSLCLTKVLY